MPDALYPWSNPVGPRPILSVDVTLSGLKGWPYRTTQS